MGQMMSNLGNANVTDPKQANWGDMDSSEKAARVTAGAGQGLLGGFQNMQQQNQAMRAGGGAQVSSPAAAPYVQPPQPQNFTAADGPGTGQGTLMNPQQKKMPGGGNSGRNSMFFGMQ